MVWVGWWFPLAALGKRHGNRKSPGIEEGCAPCSPNSLWGCWFTMFLIKKAILYPWFSCQGHGGILGGVLYRAGLHDPCGSPPTQDILWWAQGGEWGAGKAALQPRPLRQHLPQILSSLCPELWSGLNSICPPSEQSFALFPSSPSELHKPSSFPALNKSLLLSGLITSPSFLQLWGCLMERIISTSELSTKKPKPTEKQPNQKRKHPKEIKKKSSLERSELKFPMQSSKAALQPSHCHYNQKSISFFLYQRAYQHLKRENKLRGVELEAGIIFQERGMKPAAPFS